MDLSQMLKKRQFSPGPTTIPLQSQLAAIDNNPYHRSEAFNSLFLNCLEMLKIFFGTKTTPLILSSSGTGAMEAALVNFTEPGSKVLVIVGGKFGERWASMAQKYSCECTVVNVPWGHVISPDELATHLKKNPNLKAVFFQGVDTSTGVYFPIAELAKTIRKNSDALVIVDTLSSILAHELNMDEWGLDCVIAASQKGFGVGPGLSFVAVSERARSRMSTRPRYYFDLETELRVQASGKTAWTPATLLILNLKSSLQMLLSMGREHLYDYHRRMSEAVRQSVLDMDLELYVKKDFARSVTVIQAPKGVDGEKIKSFLQKNFAMTIAGGQDQLKGKIIRLAHMGFVDPFDVFAALGAIELALKDVASIDVRGKGTSAFMKNFPM